MRCRAGAVTAGAERRPVASFYPQAKVLKVASTEERTEYFLHYQGWNVRWDKWVAQGLVMKDCPETVAMQMKLKADLKRVRMEGWGRGARLDFMQGDDGIR